jgi:peptide methionine sulfoxide reductase MsrA
MAFQSLAGSLLGPHPVWPRFSTRLARPRAPRRCVTLASNVEIEGSKWWRVALSAVVLSLAAVSAPVMAADPSAGSLQTLTAETASSKEVVPIYFGNGCFWGRQRDFAVSEMQMNRSMSGVTAVAGYAGGRGASPDGRVCYYIGPPSTVYERLGHAEVVQVELQGQPDEQKQQYKRLAQVYFSQFKKTNRGMLRLDPQDEGPGYRNVIGIPGGVGSDFFPILQVSRQLMH